MAGSLIGIVVLQLLTEHSNCVQRLTLVVRYHDILRLLTCV